MNKLFRNVMIAFGFSLSFSALGAFRAPEKPVSVKATGPLSATTLAELESALVNADEDTEIIVSQPIEITQDKVIDGKGATIRYAVPYVREDGYILDEAASAGSRVFAVGNGSEVTLKNMTVMGGRQEGYNRYAVYADMGTTLTLENVTITRSDGALLTNSSGVKLLLKDCKISRNALSDDGGAIIVEGSEMIIDRCTICENRNDSALGGAALHVYSSDVTIHNSVISNNSSTGRGGAIFLSNYDHNDACLNIINSTISGNTTTYFEDNKYEAAGGIYAEKNTDGDITFNTLNSIISHNSQHATNLGLPPNSYDKSDIVLKAGIEAVYLSTLVGAEPHSVAAPLEADYHVTNDSDKWYSHSRYARLVHMNNHYTNPFYRPALLQTGSGNLAYYVPVKDGGPAEAYGVKTYFDYDFSSTEFSVIAGYYDTDHIEYFSGSAGLTEANKVDKFVNKEARDDGELFCGACIKHDDTIQYACAQAIYRYENGNPHGKIAGLTIFGESFVVGSTRVLRPIPDEGYVFDCWMNPQSNEPLGTGTYTNPKTETITVNGVLLSARFAVGKTLSYDANGGTGTLDSSFVKVDSNTGAADPTGHISREYYNFTGWNTAADGTGTAYAVGDPVPMTDDVVLYAQWALSNVGAAVNKINAIGTVEYNDASKAKIDEARAAYNALTAEEKAQVPAEILAKLTAAEAKYEELKPGQNPEPQTPDNPQTPEESKSGKKGLSGGAIAAIVICSVLVAGVGGFAVFWFVIKKKNFKELVDAIKGLFKKKE